MQRKTDFLCQSFIHQGDVYSNFETFSPLQRQALASALKQRYLCMLYKEEANIFCCTKSDKLEKP